MSGVFALPIATAIAVICGYFAVRADIRRRRVSANAILVTLVLAAGALMGAVLLWKYARLMEPLPGVIVAAFLLARAYRVPALVLLDVAAACFALALAAGHLVRWSSGSFHDTVGGTKGLLGVVILIWLWQEGRRTVQWQRPRGIVFGEFLVLRGILEFLAYWIYLGFVPVLALRSSQIDVLLSILAGSILLAIIVPRFLRTREEHRIIADVSATGESLQPEYTPATPECPHPERWKMYDSMSAEAEVLDFLKSLVIALKPSLVVETGTFMGVSTLAIAQGLKQNGFGRVITVEFDPKVFAKAKERIDASGLASWIDVRNQSSLDLRVDGPIDLLFSDSDINIREREVRHLLPQISPNGLILIHDSSSHQKVVREAALRLEAEGLLSVVLIPTPRGLVVAQKRSGRK